MRRISASGACVHSSRHGRHLHVVYFHLPPFDLGLLKETLSATCAFHSRRLPIVTPRYLKLFSSVPMGHFVFDTPGRSVCSQAPENCLPITRTFDLYRRSGNPGRVHSLLLVMSILSLVLAQE